jgi:polysaccharide biosynthesis/export protein
MIKNLLNPKNILLSYTLLFSLGISVLSFSSPIAGQNIDTSALQETLDLKKAIESGSGESEGYQDFSKSNYDNLTKQIKRVDEAEEFKKFRGLTRQKQIELAVKLCAIDEKACYLIEQYQNYKINQKIEKIEDLKVFGVDIFSGYPLSFNQSDSTGAPSDYTLRSNDSIELGIFGGLEDLYFKDLIINTQGNIIIQGYGAFAVQGLTRQQAEEELKKLLSVQLNGVDSVSINLLQSNPIQVYTLGAVSNPGGYKLSTIATPINAIIASGGVQNYSSLRRINVLRNGEIFKNLDLYKFLIDGFILDDLRLVNGDVIQIEASNSNFAILGEVNRPAIYEFKSGETILDAMKFSMGPTAFADLSNIIIKRRAADGQYQTISTSLKKGELLQAGDEIFIQPLKGDQLDYVELKGSIRNIGQYQYSSGLTLGDILNLNSDLLDNSYTGLGVIKRYNIRSRSYSMLTFDLLDQSSINKTNLNSKDEIFIFGKQDIKLINSELMGNHLSEDVYAEAKIDRMSISNASKRIQSLDNLTESENKEASNLQNECLSEIKSYGANNFIKNSIIKLKSIPALNMSTCSNFLSQNPELTPILLHHAIPVIGSVRSPGLYPFTTSVEASDMISIAGDYIEAHNSEGIMVELGRYSTSQISLLQVDGIANETDIKFLNVKTTNSHESGFVSLFGEVQYPGTFPIYKGETILDVIERAGGYTENAYPLGAILTRESIKEREELDLQRAEAELKEIFSLAMSSGALNQSATDLGALVSLMTSVSDTGPVGRVVTELDPRIIKNNRQLDIYLENGDEIYVPVRTNTISVVGSVLNPVTIPYQPTHSIKKYLSEAGGLKDYADPSKIYVLLPNGKSIAGNRFALFSRAQEILPGSTIIVPRKARPLSGLAFVEYITPVLANLSITAASINSISSN